MTPYNWNEDREITGPRSRRSQFSGAWKNYRKGSGRWTKINTLILPDRTVTDMPASVQLPQSSQGETAMLFDGSFSIKRYIEERNGNNAEPSFEMSMTVETQHNVTGHIDEANPSEMVYPGAWDSADLRLGIQHGRSVRIQKIVDIHSMPSGDSEFVDYSFTMTSQKAKIFTGRQFKDRPWKGGVGDQVNLRRSKAFISNDGSALRGAMLQTPMAWYFVNGEKVSEPIEVTFKITGNGKTVHATKHIPRALIAAALAAGSRLKTDATFSPDANPETTTVDGVVKGSSQGSWATLIGGVANYVDDSSASGDLRVQATGTSNQYEQYRHMFFGFDTSSIGAGQSVDSATLRLSFDNQRSINSLGLSSQIYASSPASNTSLSISDYMAFGSTPLTDSARDMESESFDRTNITQTLNADGRAAIDMEGVTNLGIGVTAAHESGSPTWTSGASAKINILTSETTGTANDPLLTVTHSAASSFGAWYAAANPSGY